MNALLRYEIRMFATARLTWCVLALLFAAMAWGAFNGERNANDQRAAIERVRQHEAAALADAVAEVARYARPDQAQLPYWQDPSDVAGFMRYKLVAYAVKPPSPLAGVATGQSRLLPFYLRTDLDYVAPPAASYDFVNPRALSLGEFDLAFVLVVVLPLALIVLGASRLSTERDSGALALIMAQLPSYRTVVMLKLGAMALVCVPFCLLASALALLLAGIPWWSGASGSVLLTLALAVAAYTLFWCCVCVIIASRSSVIGSYLRLVMLFSVLTFVLPAAVALGIELAYPAPSSLHYLDHLRRASDLTGLQRNALFIKHLAAFPQYAEAAQRIDKVPYATKMMFVQRDIEQQMRPRLAAVARQQLAARRTSAALRWLSPPMVLDNLLQQAAGTDAESHRAFLAQADAYTETLRGFFWPRALEEAARPSAACAGCAARLNFVAHGQIPRFAARPLRADMVGALAPSAAYVCLLAFALFGYAGRRRNSRLA